MGECVGGKEHSEVITASDDPGRYKPEVFAAYGFTPPNGHQWGYCVDCEQPFRWSVAKQRWRPWPGGLAQLPQYTEEELERLQAAVERSGKELDELLELSQAPGMRAELAYERGLVHSLVTSIAEAQFSLWPAEGPHEPRAWGEAWTVLARWIDVQVEGIGRSSPTDAGVGAMAAFEQVRKQMARLGAVRSRAGHDPSECSLCHSGVGHPSGRGVAGPGDDPGARSL